METASAARPRGRPRRRVLRGPRSSFRIWNPQRGVVFIAALILLTAMTTVLVALANEVSLDLKMATNVIDGDQALEAAKIGIENILYLANNDANWRTTFTSGAWIKNKAVGDATFTAYGIDEDGDLTDCGIDSVTARAVATYRGATRTLSATLQPPVHDAMMYLAYAWTDGSGTGTIKFSGGPRVYGDVCAADRVTYDGSAPDLRGDIYIPNAGTVSGALDDDDTDVIETDAPFAPPVDADWLIARGSQITPPSSGGECRITDKIISTSTNPYGFSSANGIYYIDAGENDVRFTRCYIQATLVITRPKKVIFDKAVVQAPAYTYYPTVVVSEPNGNDEIIYQLDQNLSEAESNVDFNGDGDKTDTFTPCVTGVVFSTRAITALQATGGTNLVRFRGALVSKKIVLVGSGCIFEQDPSLSTDLVNQFHGSGLRLVTGSLKIE